MVKVKAQKIRLINYNVEHSSWRSQDNDEQCEFNFGRNPISIGTLAFTKFEPHIRKW